MLMFPHALKYCSHLYFLESILGPKILDRKVTGFSLYSNRTKPLFTRYNPVATLSDSQA